MTDRDEKRKTLLRICCCTCCVTGFITILVLIFGSIHVLEATEMGLDYSGIRKQIDETQLYPNGFHSTGVSHQFIKFPKSQQSTVFKNDSPYGQLEARTKDGLSVKLEMQYQYRLRDDAAAIIKLYYDWGLAYDEAYCIFLS